MKPRRHFLCKTCEIDLFMKSENLLSISPLDGRYNKSASDLRAITSEFGLIKYRVIIEIKWFLHLSSNSKIKELPKLNIKEITYLNDLINNFDITDAKRVKAIEKKTNHDVKAVEYFLKEKKQVAVLLNSKLKNAKSIQV